MTQISYGEFISGQAAAAQRLAGWENLSDEERCDACSDALDWFGRLPREGEGPRKAEEEQIQQIASLAGVGTKDIRQALAWEEGAEADDQDAE